MTVFAEKRTRLQRWMQKACHPTGWGQFLWGMCAAWGMPPAYIGPCFFGAFFVHRYVTSHASGWKSAFNLGWWFHLGFMIVSLHWIVTALGIDWVRFWWLTPLACLGLPAFLALFGGIAAACAHHILSHKLLALWTASVCYWGAEWVKGHIFTGFPWHLYGYAFTGYDVLAQSASLFGVYGLSFCAIFVVFLLVPCARRRSFQSTVGGILGGVIVISMTVYGVCHLSKSPSPRTEPAFRIRVVQPNIPQTLKWDPGEAEAHLRTLKVLSQRPADGPLDAIIWPETAIPYVTSVAAEHLPFLETLLGNDARFLITGLIEASSSRQAYPEQAYYNSMIVVDAHNTIHARYHKKHLVPFGEFVPLRQWIPLPSIAAERADFYAGKGPITLKSPLPKISWPAFSPLICYDVIFSGDVADHGPDGPYWLINITNDAWFAQGWGPQQHFHLARIRAIEEGLPLVRVANTGISALIDGHGRVLDSLPFRTRGIFDAELPLPFAETYFHQYGHKATIVFILILGLIAWCLDGLIIQRRFVFFKTTARTEGLS